MVGPSVLPSGAVRLPGEQPPRRGSHDACSPLPAWLLALGPLWLVLPRASSLSQTTLRPGEEQTKLCAAGPYPELASGY